MKITILFLFLSLSFSSIYAEDTEEYTVKDGDTLSKIAKEKLSDMNKWKELLQYNKISNPNKIRPGLVLKIPAYLSKKAQSTPIAGLKFSHGDVQFQENGSDWKKVSKGQKFSENVVIRTMEKSSAQIQYLDQPITIIQIKEKSVIKLEKNKDRGLDLKLGSIFLKVNNPNESKDIKYKVKTPTATAGVRGTEFYVSVDKEESSLLGCYKGLVDVTAEKVTVKVPAGFGTKVIKGQPPMEPFKLLDEIIPKPVKE